MATINYSLCCNSVSQEYAVLDKNVSFGARQLTLFKIKVEINGKEEWITIPASDYYKLSDSDTVIINYYEGALNFAYYKYDK